MDLKKTNYINAISYLPPAFRDNEYYVKICSLIDALMSKNSKYFSYELDQFGAVLNKYKDYRTLDNLTIHQIVKEYGYQYIVDILELPESRMKDLLAYLSLINMLKGSKPGLELVLSLLGFDYKLLEWWEDPIILPKRNTYALELYFVDMGFSGEFFKKFRQFSREYVYPLLTKIEVTFKFTYGRVYTGAALNVRAKTRIFPADN